jgi:predicted patatin/cPLA2 family phospholipase
MLGIIAEGGASRTVYSAGVMDALLEQNVTADYFIGVSAGIAFGVSYCSRQKERNLNLIKDYMCTPEYSGAKHLLDRGNRSFYNLDYVYGKVPQELLPFDFDAFADFKGNCISVVTNLKTGKAEYLETPRDDRDFNCLRASCALPLMFPPIEINGELYMDGGISDSIPFKRAIDDGCDKIIVILTRQHGYVKCNEAMQKLVLRRFKDYPQFCEAFASRAERYNRDVAELEKLRKSGKAFVFYPKKELLVSRTENDVKKLERLYSYGYRHAMWAENSLRKYLEIS